MGAAGIYAGGCVASLHQEAEDLVRVWADVGSYGVWGHDRTGVRSPCCSKEGSLPSRESVKQGVDSLRDESSGSGLSRPVHHTRVGRCSRCLLRLPLSRRHTDRSDWTTGYNVDSAYCTFGKVRRQLACLDEPLLEPKRPGDLPWPGCWERTPAFGNVQASSGAHVRISKVGSLASCIMVSTKVVGGCGRVLWKSWMTASWIWNRRFHSRDAGGGEGGGRQRRT